MTDFKKQLTALFILILLLILVFGLGFWIGYNKALFDIQEIATKNFLTLFE